MVSTRSSASKPPNPARPPSAKSVPTPVLDDPPPPYPRRSPRIRIKNGENLSVQFVSLTPSTTKQSHKQLSRDEPPEELSANDAKRIVEQSIPVRKTVKKKRHRHRHNKTSERPPQSLLQPHLIDQQNVTHSPLLVTERLSSHAIAAAQSVAQDAASRKLAAAETARLKKQVKHLNTSLKISQRVCKIDVMLPNALPRVHGDSTKRHQAAASFLTACVRKGPKRVPGSKIAMTFASRKSLRA